MKNSQRAAMGLILAVVLTACVVPSSTATYSYTVESNIVYGQGEVGGGGQMEDLLLDLYIPDIAPGNPMPLMLMIHGGGFVGGSKTGSGITAYAPEYAQRGYLVASINYRLDGDDPVPSARMDPMRAQLGGANAPQIVINILAAIDDTLTAMDFLHERDDIYAPWTILWGSSAGAVTSLLTAYSLDDFGIATPPIAAVIDLWGGLYGISIGTPFDDPENDAALFITHGTADPTVPYAQTETIVAQLAAAGGPENVVYPIEGAGHGYNLFNRTTPDGTSLFQATVDFLSDTVFNGLPEGPILELFADAG